MFDAGMTNDDYYQHAPLGEKTQLALSLPYGVFVISFINGEFSNMHHGWRTSPISSLNDYLCHPILPNINKTRPTSDAIPFPDLP